MFDDCLFNYLGFIWHTKRFQVTIRLSFDICEALQFAERTKAWINVSIDCRLLIRPVVERNGGSQLPLLSQLSINGSSLHRHLQHFVYFHPRSFSFAPYFLVQLSTFFNRSVQVSNYYFQYIMRAQMSIQSSNPPLIKPWYTKFKFQWIIVQGAFLS